MQKKNLVGWCAVALGVLGNQYLLPVLLRPVVGEAVEIGRLPLLWGLQGALITGGALILIGRLEPARRRQVGFSLVTLVLLLILAEAGTGLVRAARSRAAVSRAGRIELPDQPWQEQWHREFQARIEPFLEYRPFVEWGRRPFSGQYIHINEQGMRVTENNPDPVPQGARQVYVFGGATVWGFGSRDGFTVPSCLARLLNDSADDGAYVVSNYGELANVTRQELVRLVLLLRAGHRPDYVIFYDGVNDSHTAYHSGEPGRLFDQDDLEAKFEGPDLPEPPVCALFSADRREAP